MMEYSAGTAPLMAANMIKPLAKLRKPRSIEVDVCQHRSVPRHILKTFWKSHGIDMKYATRR